MIGAILARLAGPLVGPAATVVAVVALGLAVGQCSGRVKAESNLQKMQSARDAWRTSAQSWIAYGKAEKAAYDASERLRDAETVQSRAALSDAALACNARVARARASGMAISAIINKEPARDPNGCPVRTMADPGVLRRALVRD